MQGEERLKVLFLTAWYLSEVHSSTGVTVKEHAKAASIYNDIVVLFAYSDPSPRGYKPFYSSEEIEDEIRIVRVKCRSFEWNLLSTFSGTYNPFRMLGVLLGYAMAVARHITYYSSLFIAFRKLIREGWKPDVIHAHVFSAAVPAVLLGKIYRIPIVVTERFSDIPLQKLGFFQRVKFRFAMRSANLILPVSSALKEAIEAYGVANDFQVVPNVVNTEMFYPTLPKDRVGEKKRILLVAGLTPIKGISYLLQSLALVRKKRQDFVLDIVGDGVNRSEYEELVQELGLGDIVSFQGLKRKEEVARFMRSCDFMILPSLYETFGAVIIEALSSGKPVVASDIGGIREILNEQLGILVPPGDLIRLRHAVDFMLDNYASYSPQVLSRHAKDKYGYESVGLLLNTIYRKQSDNSER